MTAHPESDFRAAMAASGLDFPGEIIPDGQLHRVKVNGDRGPNSWYVLHLDGLPAGSYGCWKRGFTETWCCKSSDVLTETERAERDRLWAKQREKHDTERRRAHDEARAQAQAILDAAKPATSDHPYLKRKGIKAHPGVLVGHWPQWARDNCLLIPLRTASGQLATVQAIFPDKPADGRDKDFLRGGAKQGAFFAIGDLAAAPCIVTVEGYATAATIHEVTGHPAVMAVDAGNLRSVAEALRALHPGKRIIIAADNDRHTEGNPGITKATIAAQAIKADLAIPVFAEGEAGTDFNDLARVCGADAVRSAIAQARPVEREPGEDDEPFEEPQREPTEHGFISMCDFIARPPANSYRIKKVLPASGIGQIFGDSHVGKSFSLIDLCGHVAMGWDWHGFKTKRGAVLYIAAEGLAGLTLRWRAWFDHHKETPPSNLWIHTVPVGLTIPGAAAAIAERMNQLPERPAMIALDTFATNFGKGSENCDEDMRAALMGLQVLQGDGLILSAHHTGHGDKTRGRGHSSLFAAIDVEIQATQDTNGILTLAHTKFRDRERLKPIMSFQFDKVSLPWVDEDGEPLNSAVLVPTESSAQPNARMNRAARIALEVLRAGCAASPDGWMYVADWRKAALAGGITLSDVKSSRYSAFARALEELDDAKLIVSEGEKWQPI